VDRNGIVIKSTGSWYSVLEGNTEIQCRIKGKLRLKGIKTTNPVTVGDRVVFETAENNTGIIVKIEERKNYIIRKSTSFDKEAHLLAVNIDQAIIIATLRSPETPAEFIDRFLVTAEAYHIPSIVLFNKSDLLVDSDLDLLEELKDSYIKAGYICFELSVVNNSNIARVKELINKKITLIAGNSGVGKSSLINSICPELNLKIAEVSSLHKSGKHTTTFSEMFKAGDDTFLIDSPGIRGFGLIDLSKADIGLYFPEIFSVSKNCKFYNCSHVHEPHCAVIEYVKEGKIGFSRYKSYLNMVTEENSKYRQ
jgi:ribosome biogenesis GTPase / thiamine phosphate phosphatase